jgi:hypothetical protein
VIQPIIYPNLFFVVNGEMPVYLVFVVGPLARISVGSHGGIVDATTSYTFLFSNYFQMIYCKYLNVIFLTCIYSSHHPINI